MIALPLIRVSVGLMEKEQSMAVKRMEYLFLLRRSDVMLSLGQDIFDTPFT